MPIISALLMGSKIASLPTPTGLTLFLYQESGHAGPNRVGLLWDFNRNYSIEIWENSSSTGSVWTLIFTVLKGSQGGLAPYPFKGFYQSDTPPDNTRSWKIRFIDAYGRYSPYTATVSDSNL